jgi:hypothetical protein
LSGRILPALIAAIVISLPASAQTTRKARSARHATKSWSPAGAWRSVYSDPTVKVAVDTSQTLRQPDGTYKVRLRWQYASSQMIGTRHAYRTMVDRKLIDCTTQGIKPISAETFDATGKAVAGYDTTDTQVSELDWAKRPPGSSAGKAYAAVCGAIRK